MTAGALASVSATSTAQYGSQWQLLQLPLEQLAQPDEPEDDE